MRIKFVEIMNFRKLKSCRIDLSTSTTVFVGANNSGKTSAIDALVAFLADNSRLCAKDFTIANWIDINNIGEQWKSLTDASFGSRKEWDALVPTIDIWISVERTELHYVASILPTLSWSGEILGVRLQFAPKDIPELFAGFIAASKSQSNLQAKDGTKLKSSHIDLYDFLNQSNRIQRYFKVSAFILDESKINPVSNGLANMQLLGENAVPLDSNPLKGLIKVDFINAQRGFTDANSGNPNSDLGSAGSLSNQLREYYNRHIGPGDLPQPEDVDALLAIEQAQDVFDKNIAAGFSDAIKELETIGYPGFSNPKITISSKVQPIDGLNHPSAVQFEILKGRIGEFQQFRLPEKYNGLGYQNLISIIFKLMRFRDEWMRVGKLQNQLPANAEYFIEPLHLVFIEEPEAHLHAQVQQVFINKAYSVLRNHKNLHDGIDFITQLVVTTHSSHIAHAMDFANLRYFRRSTIASLGTNPTATIVNMSETFGSKDETTKFIVRYLKATHCDLFFADAAILVEGPAERILLPYFVQKDFSELTCKYLSILEIGGSHAHRLRGLIENLGIPTLIITDIDSVDPANKGSSTPPARGKGYSTNNSTIKSWVPQKLLIDELYAVPDSSKISSTGLVRVVYQGPCMVKRAGGNEEVLPYTFEDALIFENTASIMVTDATRGLLKLAKGLLTSQISNSEIEAAIFAELKKQNKKALFAMDLLYSDEAETLNPPQYIRQGLQWLIDTLKDRFEPTIAAGELRR